MPNNALFSGAGVPAVFRDGRVYSGRINHSAYGLNTECLVQNQMGIARRIARVPMWSCINVDDKHGTR